MATVRHLEYQPLSVETQHSETTCTYSIVRDHGGVPYLQLDTYGSRERQIAGKKSQSIRLAPEAIQELRVILATHFTDW
jgi:hypothetical protein